MLALDGPDRDNQKPSTRIFGMSIRSAGSRTLETNGLRVGQYWLGGTAYMTGIRKNARDKRPMAR